MGETLGRHFFVSYAREDGDLLATIVPGLLEQDFPVWQDTSRIRPGTPDWEQAIREAVDHGHAVVVFVTPRTAASAMVATEVQLALAAGVPLIPVWLEGDEWVRCAPMSMARMQHTDLRSEPRESWTRILDSHLRPFFHEVDGIRPASGGSALARDLLRVRLTDRLISAEDRVNPQDPELGEEDLDVEPLRYPDLNRFLDDLYRRNLSARFQPNSYGTEWVLQYEGSARRGSAWGIAWLCVPWEWARWASQAGEPERPVTWQQRPLAAHGLRRGTVWSVRSVPSDLSQLDVVALATDSETLADLSMSLTSKSLYAFDRGAGFTMVSLNDSAYRSMPFTRVGLLDSWSTHRGRGIVGLASEMQPEFLDQLR